MKMNEYAVKYKMSGVVYINAQSEDDVLEKFECLSWEELKDNIDDIEWEELEIQ